LFDLVNKTAFTKYFEKIRKNEVWIVLNELEKFEYKYSIPIYLKLVFFHQVMSKKALSLFQDDGTPEKLGGSPGVKSRDKKLRKSRNAEYYKQR
jgi:hypothetical protein